MPYYQLHGSGPFNNELPEVGNFNNWDLTTPPSSTQVVIGLGNVTFTFIGTGLTTSGSYPTGGTISSIQRHVNGVLMDSWTGLSLSGATFANWISTNNNTAFQYDLMFEAEFLQGSSGNDTIYTYDGVDYIQGMGGNDVLFGGAGDDILRGDGGSNWLGPWGNDTLYGGDGDDLLYGGDGVDTFYGGDGFDRISFFYFAGNQGIVASLLTQTMTNDGFGNAEVFDSIEALGAGTAYADHLTGDHNDNLLIAGRGDTIIANGGNDDITLYSMGALIDGGDGIDTIQSIVNTDYIPDNNGNGLWETISTTNGAYISLANNFITDGFGYTGVVQNVENVGGSMFDDVIIGDENANHIWGYDGYDEIYGMGGDDIIEGGAGWEQIDGGDGVDTLVLLGSAFDWSWFRSEGEWHAFNSSLFEEDDFINIEILQFDDRTVYIDEPGYSFYGDWTSDILLRRNDGTTAIWQMDGSSVTGAAVTTWQAPSDWQIQGIGDFNNDDRSDFLLRRTDGITAVWTMDGVDVTAADVTQWQAGLEWQIQGIGDFNGDGFDDILWRRNSDSVTSIWSLNGTQVTAAGVTDWQAGAEWVVSGVGDFNGDGKDDFILRRATDGVMAMWFMDGTTVDSAGILNEAGLAWNIAGVGDFNGDAIDDLLLRRDDGVTAIWLMDGTYTMSADVTTTQVGNDWAVAAVGDYNGDGTDDILLRNDNGLLAVWEVEAGNVISAEFTSQTAGVEWGII